MMDFGGNEPARALVSPHCIELEKKAVSCHEIEDPLSNVRQHLNPTPITNTAAVYVKVGKNPDGSTKIIKIGCTGRLKDRINKDKEKNIILTDDDYILMLDFGNVGIDFYLHCESKYKHVMTEMTGSKDLSIFQHLLFRAIHFDEGWRLGAKKSIMLQMLEYGCQKKIQLSAPAEFLMYDHNVLKR